ncbi:acyl-Coenzyme A oxidase [Allomyces javanicus]|nr:acyl-Coenzyme A oxidase [Allomyces javanicus]
MSNTSDKSGVVAISADQGRIDYSAERARAQFDVEEMRAFLLGGPDRAAKMALAYRIIERDPILSFQLEGGHPFDMTRPELRAKTMAQLRRVVEVRRTFKDKELDELFLIAMCELSESFSMRLFVTEALFVRSFRLFGTRAQQAEWVPKILAWESIGCFAMTELGHSSNLRGIETTATYDAANRDFIIDTPSLMATKIWIGMAGETATHTACLARLLVRGQDCGLHWFVVPLRDPETGRLMPGVTAGDVGAKAGRNGLDNGWIQFTHVRVPRDAMLARWAHVAADGTFHAGLNPEDADPANNVSPAAAAGLAYAGLIPERLEITRGIPMMLNQALTIAVRYAAGRRQGPAGNPQVLDYPSIQAALMPALARMHAVMAAAGAVWTTWHAMEEGGPNALLQGLPDMHALSAGIKATVTWDGADILERCRRAMGGHAYSRYNAIADYIGDYGVMTTGGGDNAVLVQQTARYVLAMARKAMSDPAKFAATVAPTDSVAYLPAAVALAAEGVPPAVSDWSSLAQLHVVLQWLAVAKVQALGMSLAAAPKGGMTRAWNAAHAELSAVAQLHTHQYLARAIRIRAGDLAPTARDSGAAPAALQSTFVHLARLYLLDVLRQFARDLLLHGWARDAVEQLDAEFADACAKVRDQAMPLVDAFGLPDWILQAPLARADGDGYRAYLATIQNAPNCFGPPKYWDAEVRPLTAPAGRSRL